MAIKVGFYSGDSAPYAELGEYIFALNPYGAVPPPREAWTAAYPPAIVTIQLDDDKQGYLYFLDTSGIEHNEKPGSWKFKYADHYIQRALRIPYMYYKQSEFNKAEGVLVRDYFLIGFEGGAGY
jgi:hypothetical protein